MRSPIYADHNATTPVSPAARAAVLEALEAWGNPSSSHGVGRKAKELLEKARNQVAGAAKVDPKEVVFTSGGSEANAAALLGMHYLVKGFRLVTADTEHSSVREVVSFVEKQGAQVLRLRILPSGAVDLDHLEEVIGQFQPHVVSLMAANNETGVLLDSEKAWQICNRQGAIFHSDCVQAFGKLSPELWNMADLLTISSHKIGGPKGVGALIVRRGCKLIPLPFGGTQEVKRRGGTQNMPGIAGFGAAAELLLTEGIPSPALRDRFESLLKNRLAGVTIHGEESQRAPNTTNVRIEGVLSEVLLSILDLEGICVSAGSACSSGSHLASPVLLAMGLSKTESRECLRVSWGRGSTLEEVEHAADVLVENVLRIRTRMSSRANPPPIAAQVH